MTITRTFLSAASLSPITLSTRGLSVCTLALCASLVACDQSGSTTEAPQAEQQPAVESRASSSEPSEAPTSAYQAWSCPAEPGSSPTGELVAERIVAANSTRDEPGLYEGPVWLNDALYFSDFTFSQGFPSRIQRLSNNSVLETFMEESGSNGLAKDADGYLIAGTHSTKSLSRFDSRTGERSKIVGMYDGNAFNSPNDLTEARDGNIFFTDPDFQRSAALGGQEKTNVFRVAPDGVVTVVDDTISNPNGISLSPAQDVLYVAGGGDEGFIRAYPLVDGVPGEGKNLVEGVQVPDGMAIDCLGNIYATEHTLQRLRVFSPEGKHLATIKVDANITNAAFGGPERKTLYITGAGAVWSIDLNVAGLPY
jgi:gluconolactonase